MENVCDQMKSYVSRARRKFPYIKGGIMKNDESRILYFISLFAASWIIVGSSPPPSPPPHHL